MLKRWIDLSLAVLLYLTVLIYQGYLYGVSDQSQILPCIWAQDHPGAYPKDHYVQTYLHSPVNERTIFHFAFRYLGYAHPWVVWIWHAVLSVTLIWAWVKMCGFFIKNPGFRFLTIALILTLGFHTHTGSNEIYYNAVVPSLAAKAFGSWALYYWLTAQSWKWSIWLVIATLLQPLVGLQLFLLTALASLVDYLLHRAHRTMPWRESIAYMVAIAPWLFLLIRHNGGHQDPKGFFDIIHFRLSHHFFASSFGWFNLLLMAGFATMTCILYKQKMKWFFILATAGCFVYEAFVEWYHIPVVLYTQWWKTTIWIEAFALIAIGAYLNKWFSEYRVWKKYPLLIPALFIILVGLYRLGGWLGTMPEYMFPWSASNSPEVDISLQAEKLTPPDALFVIPLDLSAFRWYSKRSNYVDYKAMLHQEAFLKDWYARLQQIYQYGIAEQQGGFDIRNFSRYLLEEPSPMSVAYWKKLGITHIISTGANARDLELVGKNERYFIYKLQ